MSAPTAIHGGAAPLASLTSVFTPPCPTTWLITTTRLLSQYPAFPTAGPSSCNPPSWRANIAGQGFEYYSPAVCPQGFVVGPSCGLTKTRAEEGFPTVAPQETVAYCVPQGLTCTTDTTDYRGGVWGYVRDATTYGATVTIGPAIQIRWRESDLTKLETHPLIPGLTAAATTDMAVAVASTPVFGSDVNTISIPTSSPSDVLITDTTVPASNSQGSIRNPAPFPTGQPPSDSAGASGSNDGGVLGSLNRTNSIIVIVIITVAVAGILAGAAFFLVRRYKQKKERLKASVEDGQRSSTWPAPSHRGTFTSTSSQQKTVRDVRSITPASSRMLGREARSTTPGSSKVMMQNPRSTTPGSRSSKKALPILDPRAAGISELDGTPPVSAIRPPHIGSTPNPAELEGDGLEAARSAALSQRSWLRSPSLHALHSPRSTRSSGRRTIRESFGEKINDPASVLGRLKIPTARSTASQRPSPASASPSALSFWRSPRSPRTPTGTTTTRLSQMSSANQYPPRVSSRKSGLGGEVVATPTIAERPDEETSGGSSSSSGAQPKQRGSSS
ncbi:hypothetical protein QBC38DRAFT_222360 [Podospora fimiseda]|uniref:Uncharacterized protein n=1 Tax=Podospora fimiseda TaxID=252190 RepID=A0AAN7BN23_9PEZI|nr:hypothetical protein QBC38DRAFT_222360 [Podospora fimiseda]